MIYRFTVHILPVHLPASKLATFVKTAVALKIFESSAEPGNLLYFTNKSKKLTVSAAWSTLWSVTSGLTCSLCRFFFSWKTPEAPSQPLGDAAERLCRNHPWIVLPCWTTVWWECCTLRLCQDDRVWSLFLRSVQHTWGVSLNCYLWFIGYRL